MDYCNMNKYLFKSLNRITSKEPNKKDPSKKCLIYYDRCILRDNNSLFLI